MTREHSYLQTPVQHSQTLLVSWELLQETQAHPPIPHHAATPDQPLREGHASCRSTVDTWKSNQRIVWEDTFKEIVKGTHSSDSHSPCWSA